MTQAHDAHESRAGDMKAGFLGLIIGAICIFAILLSIVKMTNAHFAREQPVATQPAN